MIEFIPSNENVLSILGACLDIVGAILLARSLVFVRSEGLMKQTLSGWGGINIPLLKMFAEQKVDGGTGLAYLLAGFVVQGFSGYGYKSSSLTILQVGLAIAIICFALYVFARRSMTKSIFTRACKTWQPSGSPTWTEEQIAEMWMHA